MDDPSIGEMLQDQAASARQSVRDRIGEKLGAAGNAIFQYVFEKYPAISPLSSRHPIDRWLLILSIALVVIAIFLAMQSVATALAVSILASLPIVAMAALWKHSLAARAAMGLCGVAVLLSVVAAIFFQRQEQGYKEHLQAEVTGERQKNLERVELDKARQAEEAKRKEADKAAQLQAEEAGRKAREEARNREFQAELKRNQEAEEKRRAEEKLKQDELAAQRRKLEDAQKKKAQAELDEKARAEQRRQDRLAAEEEYQAKKLASDDAAHAVEKLEGELRVAKDELFQQELIVARENSPRPPAASELARARELKGQWKKDAERIEAALVAARETAKKAAAKKDAAGKILDSFLHDSPLKN